MEIALTYKTFPGLSGEQVFFDTITAKLKNKLMKEGLEVHDCPIPHFTNSAFYIADYYLRFPSVARAYAKLKKFQSCDIIHFLGSPASPAGNFLKNPVKIVTVHNLGNSQRILSPPQGLVRLAEPLYCSVFSRIDSWTYRNADAIVAVSPFQGKDLAETYSLETSRIKHVPACIDLASYRNIQGTDLKSRFGCDHAIVFMGRLFERSKGLSYLIRAIPYLKKKNTKLLIGGEGRDRRHYEELVASLGIRDKVVFLGHLNLEKKAALQKSADVFVVPSLYDVFCLVFAEALACEVPVVAFDQPFWKGLYDDSALFVEKSPEALAKGIDKVLDDANLRKKLIANGRKCVEQYDVNKTIDAYLELYKELAARKR